MLQNKTKVTDVQGLVTKNISKYQKLKSFVKMNNGSSEYRKVAINSLKELLTSETGRVYTGMLTLKPFKVCQGIVKEYYRDVWTDEVAEVLDIFRIRYVKGYDHDKHGANGAYVEVTSPSFKHEAMLSVNF